MTFWFTFLLIALIIVVMKIIVKQQINSHFVFPVCSSGQQRVILTSNTEMDKQHSQGDSTSTTETPPASDYGLWLLLDLQGNLFIPNELL